MVRSRVVHWQLQVLTVGMAALSTVAVASSSSSSNVVMTSSTGNDPSSSMALPVLLDDEPDPEAEAEAEVSYKSKADWWKDPLAAFDDDTDNDDDVEVDLPIALEVEQPIAVEVEQPLAVKVELPIASEVEQEEKGVEQPIQEDSDIRNSVIEDDEPNDTYKSNADWWRDPLAAFDDDTDDNSEEEPLQVEESEELEVDQNKIFMEEEVEVAIPDIKDDVLEILTDDKESETEVVPGIENDSLVILMDENETIDGTTGTEEPMILPKSSQQLMNDQAVVLKAADHQIVSFRRTMAGSLAAPLALLLPSLPKVQALFTRLPVVTLLAIVTVMRVLYEPLLHLSGNRQPKSSLEEELTSPDDDDDNAFSERDRHRYRHREKHLQQEDEQRQENVEPGKRRFRRSRQAPSSQDDEADRDDIKKESPGWFEHFFPKPLSHEKLPPARVLMEKVQQLQGAAEIAVSDRDSMEREYEKASWQLQEAQTELSSLTSTTRYLKAQLIDNEHIMERAIKAERVRAKKDLTRMKEAMLTVLERERKAMRDELVKQTAEVQALLQNDPQSEL